MRSQRPIACNEAAKRRQLWAGERQGAKKSIEVLFRRKPCNGTDNQVGGLQTERLTLMRPFTWREELKGCYIDAIRHSNDFVARRSRKRSIIRRHGRSIRRNNVH